MRTAALIAILSTGCSFAIDTPPSNPTPNEYVVCSESSAAPVGDVLWILIDGLLAVGLASDNEGGGAAFFGVLTALHTVALVTGMRGMDRCKDLHADWTRRHPRTDPVSIRPYRRVRPRPAEGELGAACYPNRTCNQGLACDPRRQCVRGALGLYGLSCFPDGSCSGDLVCNSGICSRPQPAECTADVHCPEGFLCEGGFCLRPRAAP